MARPRLIAAALLVAAWAAIPATAAAPSRTTVFNDLVVNEHVEGDVVAFEADVHLGPMADVEGDVVVVSGDLRLDDRARVRRHVLAVFGEIDAAPMATVDGRTLAFSSLSSVVLRPDEGTSLQVGLAVRLLSSGGWLLVTTAIAFGLSTRLRYAVWLLPKFGVRVLVLGIAAAVTFFAAVVAVLGLGPGLGVPLAAALTVVFFGLRAIGLTVIGGVLGGMALRALYDRGLPLTLEVFAGVFGLLILRFVPVVGGVAWSGVAIAALGTGILALAASVGERRAAITTG